MSLRNILNKYGFKFKKSLGQNFIADKNLLERIVATAQVDKEDIVVEIGPGAGTLTRSLAAKAKQVIAIEIDKELLPILSDTLQGLENIYLIHGDALKINLDQLVEKIVGEKTTYKVVANLPYYITTPLIMHCLEKGFNIERIVVMVQKEVAQRLQAQPGTKDYGALTVNVNFFAQADLAFVVPRQVFTPQPDVDSAIVDLKVRKEPPYPIKDTAIFKKVVKAAFNQRRKTLHNSLKLLGIPKDEIADILLACDIDPKRRGETLTMEEFVRVANRLFNR